MIIKSSKVHRIFVFFLVLFMVGCSSSTSIKDSQSIDILKIGDRVIDTTWDWEFLRGYGYTPFGESVTESVIWIVVAKDHYGSGVTLM
ncbi:MAG: hypothetical protein HGB31_09620, partial [Erysipelotrichaceae bacterium]|nr:hypothetical protein [Erysipelotrichaceae bacterium]